MGHDHSRQRWVHLRAAVQPEQRGQHGQRGDTPAREGGRGQYTAQFTVYSVQCTVEF